MLSTIAHASGRAAHLKDPTSGVSEFPDGRVPGPGGAFRAAIVTHRVCAQENASYVRAMCIYDTSVLPRFHQEDRGWSNRRRGHHEYAPAGSYSKIPAWSGRFGFLAAAQAIMATTRGRRVLHEAQVSPQLLRTYLLVRTGYVQQQRTGRRCIVRPDVLASVLDIAENTVHRCQRAARRLGIEVVAWGGRMLREQERFDCWRRGSRQRGLSTEVAFTIPKPWLVVARSGDLVTPVRDRASSPKNRTLTSSPTSAASGEKADATPSRPRHEGLDRLQHQARRRVRARTRRVAEQLRRRLPWLTTESIGRCIPALTRFATADPPWTADHITYVLADHALRRGITRPLREELIATRPAVVLAGLLRHVDEVADHPDAPPFSLTPCGQPDCDGHGWITIPSTTGAHTVAPCPNCPPGIRGLPDDLDDTDPVDVTAHTPTGAPVTWAGDVWGQEPPF